MVNEEKLSGDGRGRRFLRQKSLFGFAQGHTGTRTRSSRTAVCPTHYSFQIWQYPSTDPSPPPPNCPTSCKIQNSGKLKNYDYRRVLTLPENSSTAWLRAAPLYWRRIITVPRGRELWSRLR
ncbi:hypothetical protein EVAR_62414_1 [Eumeta japonica]|uniref:Uncharacterized protein n=1 Tax=Eumeta variegata TaxID=151549 RepID=A0A4C1ZPH9_EUMVA|nr:hypothetical protein EVAR_62414_1 [Eumeta japonica]